MTRHLIIGGGPVATNAIESIRQFGSDDDQITLVSDEPAHSRMALPYWLAGQIPESHTHTADARFFQQQSVDTKFGRRATAVDPVGRTVTLDDDSTQPYDRLLLATGASPMSLPIDGATLPNVQPLWNLAQTRSLMAAAETRPAPRVTMIGAGFIGFIMLNAMYKRGWQLSVVERESHVLPRMLDRAGAAMIERWLTDRRIQLSCGTTVTAIRETADGSRKVELANGETIETDVVVVATGIQPNLDLGRSAGLDIDQGIRVDACMRTSQADIFAGGDVAQGPVLGSEKTEVHAIQPTAVDHGRIAGANMAGHHVAYPGSLLMNVLDCCGLQCASFGDWGGGDEAITIHNPQGQIYRRLNLNGDRLVGAMFIGRADDLGMLTDVGMVKGMLQTETTLGRWKSYLRENPFDVRRVYVATGAAQRLRETTLLGSPTRPRQYRFQDVPATTSRLPAHAVFTQTKPD